MATDEAPATPQVEDFAGSDRRRKPRIYDPIPLNVRGVGADGEPYEFETVTVNIGAGGVCALAPRTLRAGEVIFLSIRFLHAGSAPPHAPKVAARATVQRAEELPGGLFQFAAQFTLRRIV